MAGKKMIMSAEEAAMRKGDSNFGTAAIRAAITKELGGMKPRALRKDAIKSGRTTKKEWNSMEKQYRSKRGGLTAESAAEYIRKLKG